MKLKVAKPRPYAQTIRAQSAEATGERIVDAFLSLLMAQWYDEITLDHVGAVAGTTVQTIIRRFRNKDGLLAAAVAVLGKQINARRVLDIGDLEGTICSLMKDYEQTGDPVLRLLALEPRHPSLKGFLDHGRSEHRRWVAEAFARELASLAPAVRERTIDMLIIVTDVYTWKLLRRDMGRPVAAATAAVQAMVKCILAEI